MAMALSEQEILDEVMVGSRRAYPPLPGLRVIERPGWLQIITPSITTGIPLATSHARESTSAPILERMGFETVCRYPRYFG